jgi:hypothetical protein
MGATLLSGVSLVINETARRREISPSRQPTNLRVVCRLRIRRLAPDDGAASRTFSAPTRCHCSGKASTTQHPPVGIGAGGEAQYSADDGLGGQSGTTLTPPWPTRNPTSTLRTRHSLTPGPSLKTDPCGQLRQRGAMAAACGKRFSGVCDWPGPLRRRRMLRRSRRRRAGRRVGRAGRR